MLGEQRGRGRLDLARGSASSSPAMTFSSVDLPAPLRPISAIRSPAWACSVTPRRTAGPSRSSSQTSSTESSAPCARGARGAASGARSERRASPCERRASRRRPPPRPAPPSARERAARLFDRHRASRPGRRARTAARRGGAGAGQPRARRLVGDEPAVAQLDHPVGGGQAALQPVLGEQDRGPPLLVEPAQDAEQLVARDRVQLRGRLVEQQQPRPPRQRGGERDALQLAAAQLVRRAVEQAARGRARAPPPRHPRATAGAAQPRFSSGNASSARTVPITTCVSGSWKSVPATAASCAGPCSRVSSPPVSTRPPNVPPWKCGTSPARGPQQRRLPRARAAGEQHQLAGLDRQRDVVERRAARRRDSGSVSPSTRSGVIADPAAVGERQHRADHEHGDRDQRGGRRAARRGAGRRRTAPTGRRCTPTAIPNSDDRAGARTRSRGATTAAASAAAARPPPKPRTSSVAATSVARSSAPVVTACSTCSRDAPPPGRQRCASASRAASRRSTPNSRIASAAVTPERSDTRRSAAQQLVRVDGGGEEHRGAEDRQHPQAEHGAVDQRLEREVDLARPRQVRPAEDHRRPVAGDEHVDRHHDERERHAPARRPRAARARARPRSATITSTASTAHQHRAGARSRAAARPARGTTPHPRPPASRGAGCDVTRASGYGLERERDSLPGVDREREVVAQLVLGQRGGRGGDADVVGAGDHPGRVLVRVARSRRPGPSPRRACARTWPSGSISAIDAPDGDGLANTPETAGPSSSWRAAMSLRTSDHLPTRMRSTSPGEDSRFERATLRHARVAQPLLDLVARAALAAEADEPDRQLLAVLAGPERLRERADDRRDAHRGLPVVVVPPDAVAGVELALARARRRTRSR